MMATKAYWLDGPWPGRVAVSARPRGGDWLEDELSAWAREGVGTIVSLLTPEEEWELALTEEAGLARGMGIEFVSLPVEDREVPVSESEVVAVVERLVEGLKSGRNTLVHCRQGVGRAGLLASCLLVHGGETPQAAVARVSRARGVVVPETDAQLRWIGNFRNAMNALARAG